MPTAAVRKSTQAEASKQRAIQKGVDAKDRRRGDGDKRGAMQAGARDYPEPPFPKQHHPKPGHEAMIDPAPLYDAPFYVGSKKLDGKAAPSPFCSRARAPTSPSPT